MYPFILFSSFINYFIMWTLTECHSDEPSSSLRGRWRIRTADPLLVRQMLWTSWAKRPFETLHWNFKFVVVSLLLCLVLKSECKGRDFFWTCKHFGSFFSTKLHFSRFSGNSALPIIPNRLSFLRFCTFIQIKSNANHIEKRWKEKPEKW